jgi:prepilin-type N-terminal cleavage/methylation domain-containing protein
MKSMTHKGYTLIELLVSISIFAVVMLAATSAYLAFIDANRRAQTTATIMNSLFFAVDSMARDIRTGNNYSCAGGCAASGVSSISFTDANGCSVTYAMLATTIVKSVSGPGCTTQTNSAVTDPTVTVNSLLYYVRGSTAHDALQPNVTVVIAGQATVPNSTTVVPFQIETGATQRLPDL